MGQGLRGMAGGVGGGGQTGEDLGGGSWFSNPYREKMSGGGVGDW